MEDGPLGCGFPRGAHKRHPGPDNRADPPGLTADVLPEGHDGMTARPYVLLSCAMSVDGYIDDTSPKRLLLSNDADFDRVDEVRAGCDAILIGAVTLRRDNPRLLVNSAARRAAREARGLPPYPLKVTLTASGDLDPGLKFW